MKFIIDGNLWPEKLTKKMKALMEERANSFDLDSPVVEKVEEQTTRKDEEDFSDLLNRKETEFDEEKFEPLTTEDLMDSRR